MMGHFHTEGLVQRLRLRIDPYLGSICNKLNLSVPHEITADGLEFEKKIEYALRQLKNKGYNSHEARRRLVTAITDVVGWEWKEDISELLGESGGKVDHLHTYIPSFQVSAVEARRSSTICCSRYLGPVDHVLLGDCIPTVV